MWAYACMGNVNVAEWLELSDTYTHTHTHTYTHGVALCTHTHIHTQAMSKQFIAVKECHTHCIEKLGRFRDGRREDFFGSIFHFLQFGYYWCKGHVILL